MYPHLDQDPPGPNPTDGVRSSSSSSSHRPKQDTIFILMPVLHLVATQVALLLPRVRRVLEAHILRPPPALVNRATGVVYLKGLSSRNSNLSK